MQSRNSNGNVLAIPERWLTCPRKGKVIFGKFLPFKTPLDSRYDSQVPEECRFNLQLLFSSLRSSGVKLGMIIDLTNTTRFYNKDEIGEDCVHVKLACRGHGETPSEEMTQTFIEICENFIRNKPLHVIGIHCTHGFNRTGFLIASYLYEKCAWGIDAAVAAFADARPPGIYKHDYIKELFRRYGDPEDPIPPAPALPDWCHETLPSDETADNERAPPRNRSAKIVSKEFMDGNVPTVTLLSDSREVCFVRKTINRMCGWNSDSFPGAQPVSLDRKNIQKLTQVPYQVSWKADGTRYMMLITQYASSNKVYMIDRDNTVFSVPNITFPRRKFSDQHIAETLLDGEMIIDKANGQPIPRYLIYDIVMFETQEVGKTDFNRRALCINKEIIYPREKLDKSREPFRIRAKQFYNITNATRLLSEGFAQQVSHDMDGLIFQPVLEHYIAGRCEGMLKWKPSDQNSIDFMLRITTEKKMGCLVEKIGNLYVVDRGKEVLFSTMQVKSLNQYNNKIIECKFDDKTRSWKFMRERTDKSFPNSYTTASAVLETIKAPVTKEMLLDLIERRRYHESAIPGSISGHPAPPAADASAQQGLKRQAGPDQGFKAPPAKRVGRE